MTIFFFIVPPETAACFAFTLAHLLRCATGHCGVGRKSKRELLRIKSGNQRWRHIHRVCNSALSFLTSYVFLSDCQTSPSQHWSNCVLAERSFSSDFSFRMLIQDARSQKIGSILSWGLIRLRAIKPLESFSAWCRFEVTARHRNPINPLFADGSTFCSFLVSGALLGVGSLDCRELHRQSARADREFEGLH